MRLNKSSQELDRIFGALAHCDRRALLERLAREGEARVTRLAEDFDVSLNQVSKHLKTLETAGLVRRRRAGREHRLSVDLRAVMRARDWLETYERFWADCLDGLSDYLDDVSGTPEETIDDG